METGTKGPFEGMSELQRTTIVRLLGQNETLKNEISILRARLLVLEDSERQTAARAVLVKKVSP